MPFQTLKFPAGGLVQRLDYQSQSPFTTPAALNFRTDDDSVSRERGGSRPGLAKAFSTQLGSGNPVRLLTDISWINSGVLTTTLMASANGTLYKAGSSTFAAVTSAVTLNTGSLTATSYLQKLYLASDNSGNIGVYDPALNTLTLLSAVVTDGTAPTGCSIITLWRDRLVVAGDAAFPHLWYMAKQGDPLNWDYTGGTDNLSSSAVSAENSEAGVLGEPILAVVPHSDQCIIFGCTASLWIMAGDPGNNGTLRRLSSKVGILDKNAWAYDPEGFLYFMTSDGLYMMPPGCGSTPSSVSREKLPTALLNIDRTLYTVTLAWDLTGRGLHIFVTLNAGGATTHYWVDTKTTTGGDVANAGTAGFWPQSYQSSHAPLCAWGRRNWTPTSNGLSTLLLGGSDGYVRQFDSNQNQDDGSNDIDAYVDYGPFALGGPGGEGNLAELAASIAAFSGNVNLKVRVGQSPEEAFNASTLTNNIFPLTASGLNYTHRPRARGNACVIRAENISSSDIALESLVIRVEPAGRRRK